MKTNRFVGSVLLIIGTTVGAGILGMPTVGAGAGFVWSTILLMFLAAVSVFTAFLVLEVNFALPAFGCSYSSMAEKTLGAFGKVVTWFIYLFLLYTIIVAYLIGGANILLHTLLGALFDINIPHWLSVILFTFTLGVAVYWSTRAVDYVNRGFLSVKGFLFVVTLVLLVPYIDVDKLVAQSDLAGSKYVLHAIPLFFVGFCYHFIIPSLRVYVGSDLRQIKKVIIVATLIAFFLYSWWLAVVFGIIPLTGAHSFATMAPPPSGTILALTASAKNNWVIASIKGFSTIALTTSFLGISLGLFDFLADGFKISNTKLGRLKTAGLTFFPPLVVAIFFPHGFVKAVNLGAALSILLTIIWPALMVYCMRRQKRSHSLYQVKCGNIVLLGVILFGLLGMILGIMYGFNLLPPL